MPKFSLWQNSEVEVKILGKTGLLLTFKLRRIMIEYVDALCDGIPEKEIADGLNISEADILEWKRKYPLFVDYMALRSNAGQFARGLDSNMMYGLLGNAALGTIELSMQQINAIKLIMQAKGIVNANNGAKLPKRGEQVRNFEVDESGRDD